MASVVKLLAGLAPPPFVQPVDYDGLEYKWKMFVFRPGLFKVELYFLTAVLLYIACVKLGASSNRRRVDKWLQSHLHIYEQQFSSPTRKGLIADGYSDFFVFSTGRRNVASLHTIFTLRPRHDFLQWAFHTARTFIDLDYHPVDDLQLDFKLAPGAFAYDLVWAVVAKDELRTIKKNDRWDLVSPSSRGAGGLSKIVCRPRPLPRPARTPHFPLLCQSCQNTQMSRRACSNRLVISRSSTPFRIPRSYPISNLCLSQTSPANIHLVPFPQTNEKNMSSLVSRFHPPLVQRIRLLSSPPYLVLSTPWES
ncbi:hypothetical protein AX15_007599 [Amanita polypyramis BW_CC]|nr:hypothetical protein AX15_007599 [Amanita polypyramis BW_CC]